MLSAGHLFRVALLAAMAWLAMAVILTLIALVDQDWTQATLRLALVASGCISIWVLVAVRDVFTAIHAKIARDAEISDRWLAHMKDLEAEFDRRVAASGLRPSDSSSTH